MKNVFLFGSAFLVRLFFFIFYFSPEKWRIHMLGRFDERALSLLSPDVMIKNLAAWGSYPSILSFFYRFLEVIGLLEFRIQILFWLYQIAGVWLAYRILKFSIDHFKPENHLCKLIYVSISVLILFNPSVIYLHSMNLSETGYVLILWIAFERIFKFWKSERFNDLVLVFALLGLSVVFRNMGILLVAAATVYSCYLLAKKRISFLRGLVLWFVMGISGLVFSYFNFLHDPHNGFSLNLNKGANLAQTWCEAPTIDFANESNSFWFRPPSLWKVPNAGSLFLSTEFQESGKYTQYAIECLKEDPRVLISRFRSLLNIFDGPFYPDPLVMSSSLLFRFSLLLFLMVFVWILIRTIRQNKILKDPLVGLLWFILISQFAAVFIGNMGESRFLFSFYPFLVLLFIFYLSRSNRDLGIPYPSSLWVSVLITIVVVGASRLIPTSADLSLWRLETSLEKSINADLYGFLKERREFAKSHIDMFIFQSQCRSRLALNVDCDRGDQKICIDGKALVNELIKVSQEEVSADLAICLKYYWAKQGATVPKFPSMATKNIIVSSSTSTSIALVANQAIDSSIGISLNTQKLSPEFVEKIKNLLAFQFYRVENRSEYRGAVAENKQDRQSSSLAATQFYIALDLILQNLNAPVVQDGQ